MQMWQRNRHFLSLQLGGTDQKLRVMRVSPAHAQNYMRVRSLQKIKIYVAIWRQACGFLWAFLRQKDPLYVYALCPKHVDICLQFVFVLSPGEQIII